MCKKFEVEDHTLFYLPCFLEGRKCFGFWPCRLGSVSEASCLLDALRHCFYKIKFTTIIDGLS